MDTVLARAQRELDGTVEEWRARKIRALTEALSVAESPPGFLKTRIYQLAMRLGLAKRFDVLKGLDRRNGNRSAGEQGNSADLFYWLLTAVPDDELSRVEKRRYANELQRARIARVPAKYVVGYILQTNVQRPRGARPE